MRGSSPIVMAVTRSILLVLLCGIASTTALQCNYCKNYSPGVCKDSRLTETCHSQHVCYTKVRNDGGVLKMTKGCRNRNACNNNALQNRQGCDSGSVKGQCYYCCENDDNCNVDDRNYVAEGNCEAWTEWGPCSRTCGYGLRTRTRQCLDYSQDSVSGSKARSKAKSIKCGSGSKKSKSKSKNKCEYVTQYEYDYCNTQSCEVHQCYSCNTSASVLPGAIWNCKDNTKTCSEGEQHCLYSYWAKDHSGVPVPQLAKRCADKTTCDVYIGGIGLSGKCAVLVYELAKDKITTGSLGLSPEDVINYDDISSLVKQLDEPCHVCCEGALCNEGYLPPFSALYPSAGERVRLSLLSVLIMGTALLR